MFCESCQGRVSEITGQCVVCKWPIKAPRQTLCSVTIYDSASVHGYSLYSFRQAMDLLDPFHRQYKIELIADLEEAGVLKEEIPLHDGSGGSIWRFSVLKPELLPEYLREEFEAYKEIRW